MTQWWAWRSRPHKKPYGPVNCIGPYPTREVAIGAAFDDADTDEVGSAYGTGPHFDIRWVRREEWNRQRAEVKS